MLSDYNIFHIFSIIIRHQHCKLSNGWILDKNMFINNNYPILKIKYVLEK